MVATAPLESYDLRIEQGRVRIYMPDMDPKTPMADLVLELIQEGKSPESFEAVRFELVEDGFDLHAQLQDIISLDVHITHDADLRGLKFHFRLVNPAEDMRCRVQIGLRNLPGADPRWMIPGVFYNHNRTESSTRLYPAYTEGSADEDHMISPAWSFRSDRSATPGVFIWTSSLGAWVLTDERVGITDENRLGLAETGLYFQGGAAPREIGMRLPYTETPIKY